MIISILIVGYLNVTAEISLLIFHQECYLDTKNRAVALKEKHHSHMDATKISFIQLGGA